MNALTRRKIIGDDGIESSRPTPRKIPAPEDMDLWNKKWHRSLSAREKVERKFS